MHYELAFLDENKLSQTAELWFSGWYEAHGKIVPSQLVSLRTRESFSERLREHMINARIAISGGDVLGLCILKKDELYQMYVSPKARGTGLAQDLMRDAEIRLRDSGHKKAWLACALGNERARRFYEKSGWRNAGAQTVDLDTSDGAFPLEVWHLEKELA